MAKVDQPVSLIPGQLKGLHLFHFDAAPCAQRVRFALGEKGLSRGREEQYADVSSRAVQAQECRWVSRRVNLSKKEHMTDVYAEIHPNMVVPALVHDGILHLESLDIITYLDEAFGGDALIPKDAELNKRTMARVEEAKKLHLSLRYVTFYWGLGRLAMLNRKEQKNLARIASKGNDQEKLMIFYDGYSNKTVEKSVYVEHLILLNKALHQCNEAMADGRQFFMCDEVTIADPFWAMKILRLLECGYPVAEQHPRVYAWYQRMYQRPSFQNEVMAKNRLSNRFFHAKSKFESVLGIGLKKEVKALAAA